MQSTSINVIISSIYEFNDDGQSFESILNLQGDF